MPIELSFETPLQIEDREHYINECCIGGDVISAWLRPLVEEHYDHLRAAQEDWGWFLWFRDGEVSLAIDITCDDPDAGTYRVLLISRRRRAFFFWREVDTPELATLEARVVHELTRRLRGPPRVAHAESL